MKETYYIVHALKQQSGFKWDESSGADIGPESAAVWDAYVAVSVRLHIILIALTLIQRKT